MPAYRSHKKVWALKIATVTPRGDDGTTDENPIVIVTFEDTSFADRTFNLRGKPTPEAGWYYVQYEDGYESFSPAKQFEAGNTLITANDNQHGVWHGIGWAVKQLNGGLRVRRAGWNGKGMFLILVAGSEFQVNRAPLNTIYPEGTWVSYHAHVDLFNAQGKLVPWNASQGDLLATDWEIAE